MDDLFRPHTIAKQTLLNTLGVSFEQLRELSSAVYFIISSSLDLGRISLRGPDELSPRLRSPAEQEERGGIQAGGLELPTHSILGRRRERHCSARPSLYHLIKLVTESIIIVSYSCCMRITVIYYHYYNKFVSESFYINIVFVY